jgi:hypothetical protein
MTGGAYLLPHGWQDDAIFGNAPYSLRDAWAWLVDHAAYRDTVVHMASKAVVLRRGQVCGSLRYLAAQWRWSVGAVQRFLKKFAAANRLAATAENGQTIITIRGYDDSQKLARRRASADSPADTPPARATPQISLPFAASPGAADTAADSIRKKENEDPERETDGISPAARAHEAPAVPADPVYRLLQQLPKRGGWRAENCRAVLEHWRERIGAAAVAAIVRRLHAQHADERHQLTADDVSRLFVEACKAQLPPAPATSPARQTMDGWLRPLVETWIRTGSWNSAQPFPGDPRWQGSPELQAEALRRYREARPAAA